MAVMMPSASVERMLKGAFSKIESLNSATSRYCSSIDFRCVRSRAAQRDAIAEFHRGVAQPARGQRGIVDRKLCKARGAGLDQLAVALKQGVGDQGREVLAQAPSDQALPAKVPASFGAWAQVADGEVGNRSLGIAYGVEDVKGVLADLGGGQKMSALLLQQGSRHTRLACEVHRNSGGPTRDHQQQTTNRLI